MNHGFMAQALSGERKARKQVKRAARKKLEAAAPDLLAACELAFQWHTNPSEKPVMRADDLEELLEAAIAKAKP